MSALAVLAVVGSVGLLVLMVVAAYRAIRERPERGVGLARTIERAPAKVIDLDSRRVGGAKRN